MRVLVNCPGSWSHGLDSPERGEGRWAQNYARFLSKQPGIEVHACSGGEPTWGRGDPANVTLLSEQRASAYGPYDLYFDASWSDKKEPVAKAKAYVHVHFGYEPRLGIPFPDGHYLASVLRLSGVNYVGEGRGNADRTFYLPAPFCQEMAAVEKGRVGVVSTLRGSSDVSGRASRFNLVYEAISRLRGRGFRVPFTWIAPIGTSGFEHPRHEQDEVLVADGWGIPYCEMRAILYRRALNLALDGWSNVLDATVLGVPSLGWEGGVDATIGTEATKWDLLLKPDADLDRVTIVVERLVFDHWSRVNYVAGLQAGFSDHTEAFALDKFYTMANRVLR